MPACWLSHTSVAVWVSLALVGAPSSCGLSDLTGPLARSKDGRILKHFCYQPKGCHSATSGGSALPPSANPSVIPRQGGGLTTKPGNTGQQSQFQKDLTSIFFAIDIFTFQTLKCCKDCSLKTHPRHKEKSLWLSPASFYQVQMIREIKKHGGVSGEGQPGHLLSLALIPQSS